MATTSSTSDIGTSEASEERAFSLLENSFNHQQRSSLEDVSVMLQYNRK